MAVSRSRLNAGYIILVIVWSTTYMFIKISVGATPFLAASLRFLIGAAILMSIQRFRGKSLIPIPGTGAVIAYIGLFNYFIGYGFTYWAMPYLYSSVVSVLWATLPMFVAFFAHFVLPDERFNLAKSISLVMALYGSYLIFDVGNVEMEAGQGMAYLMIMISIVAAAYSNVFYKLRSKTVDLDAFLINAYGMLIGAVLLAVSSLITEPWHTVVIDGPMIGATLYLAVLGSAVAFTLYFVLMKHFTVVRMSYVTFLIPIFASIVGWVFLDEVLTPKIVLGGAIILLGVLLPDLQKRLFGGSGFRTAADPE